MGEIDGTCYSSAIVTDATAMAFYRSGAHQVLRRADDRLLAAVGFTGTATIRNGSDDLPQSR